MSSIFGYGTGAVGVTLVTGPRAMPVTFGVGSQQTWIFPGVFYDIKFKGAPNVVFQSGMNDLASGLALLYMQHFGPSPAIFSVGGLLLPLGCVTPSGYMDAPTAALLGYWMRSLIGEMLVINIAGVTLIGHLESMFFQIGLSTGVEKTKGEIPLGMYNMSFYVIPQAT